MKQFLSHQFSFHHILIVSVSLEFELHCLRSVCSLRQSTEDYEGDHGKRGISIHTHMDSARRK